MSNAMDRLYEIVVKLRSPDGCPWDREQTHESLRATLLEESYETIDAINRSDDKNLREELGDLLLNVVMHSHMAHERGAFSLDEVIHEISEKLIRRHPHVFGDTNAVDSAAVLLQWEEIKRQEKGQKDSDSVLEGVPAALPALMRAQKIQKKAAKVGFDWPDVTPVLEKIHEECGEIIEAMEKKNPAAVAEEVGDLLFSVVNLARKLKVDSELALDEATAKFIGRFQKLEQRVLASNRRLQDLTLSEMDEIWDAIKDDPKNEICRT